MAGSSLFALIDDISTILNDVAVMTKVAAKKTAGVLGDDLALNAQQVSGVNAERELPVVWAVAKGSFKNKLILVPLALAISALLPWAVLPLLMFGGVYLCYEGVEKLAHSWFHTVAEEQAEHDELVAALSDPSVDLVVLEQAKIQGAIRTDFVLSAEIITIALGTVATRPFLQQMLVLAGIGVIMTVGVYGFVAGIVKLDDLGLYLSQRNNPLQQIIGDLILKAAPYLMKSLSVVGTVAMFLVGGGIITHGIPGAHDLIHHVSENTLAIPLVGWLIEKITPAILDGLTGVLAGLLALVVMTVVGRLRRKNPTVDVATNPDARS